MSMNYIRLTYGVPVRRGGRVRPINSPHYELIVTSATHHVHAKPAYGNVREIRTYHPLDLEYKTTGGWVRGLPLPDES